MEFEKVFVVERIGLVNVVAVEALAGGLVAADEKDSASAWVEGVEDTDAGLCLDSEFSHVGVTRGLDGGGVREAKANAPLDEGLDSARRSFLVRNAERVPPGAELIGVLDGYGHRPERLAGDGRSRRRLLRRR